MSLEAPTVNLSKPCFRGRPRGRFQSAAGESLPADNCKACKACSCVHYTTNVHDTPTRNRRQKPVPETPVPVSDASDMQVDILYLMSQA